MYSAVRGGIGLDDHAILVFRVGLARDEKEAKDDGAWGKETTGQNDDARSTDDATR